MYNSWKHWGFRAQAKEAEEIIQNADSVSVDVSGKVRKTTTNHSSHLRVADGNKAERLITFATGHLKTEVLIEENIESYCSLNVDQVQTR